MDKNIIVGSENIKGDITSCKLETAQISLDKESAWSLRETKTYQTYDVCSKAVISEYEVESFTGLASIGLFVGIIFFCLLLLIISAPAPRYPNYFI